MLIVHVFVHVKPESVDAFSAATLENARNSVREPGVVRFDVVQQAHQRLGATARPLHHQRAGAHAGGQRSRLAELSYPEDDPCRRRELEVHFGRSHAAGSGNSAWYFSLRRGSAIIGSTVSHHVA